MTYDDDFYRYVSREAKPSADALLERFFQIVLPESVLDVGCAEGAWLRAATDHGVADVMGIDFHDDGQLDRLQIPADRFMAHDLRTPFQLDRTFDVALCLEVGEHLPKTSAATLVASICAHADIVVWSAALPLQGGDGHLNEQWPDYWIDLFAGHDFDVSGRLRWECWYDERIAVFYRQNLFVFANEAGICDPRHLTFAEWFAGPHRDFTIRVVHPAQFGEKLGVRFL